MADNDLVPDVVERAIGKELDRIRTSVDAIERKLGGPKPLVTLQCILEDTDKLLELLRSRDHPELRGQQHQLEVFSNRLHTLCAQSGFTFDSHTVHSLERSFRSIVESDSRLGAAWMVVTETGLIDVLSEKLRFYDESAKKRRLTDDELALVEDIKVQLLKSSQQLQELRKLVED